MNHRCPIEGCTSQLPTSKLLCARHWRMLPLWQQSAVHRAWNHGKPGVDYLAARQEAMERVTRRDKAIREARP